MRSRLARAAALAAACPVIGACVTWWPKIRNEFFVLAGSRNEAGGWYGFHSGLGGAAYISVVPALALFYWHQTCHASPWCLRWGKYPAAGGLFKTCHLHHPDLRGTRPHLDLIHRMHREARDGRP